MCCLIPLQISFQQPMEVFMSLFINNDPNLKISSIFSIKLKFGLDLHHANAHQRNKYIITIGNKSMTIDTRQG